MKKRILLTLLCSGIVLANLAALTPGEFMDHVQRYFLNKDRSIFDDTIEIYSSDVKIPLSVDSLIFMFYNGIKADDPAGYEEFAQRVGESGNTRLSRITESIGGYDLQGYLADPRIIPAYADNLTFLYFASGDQRYLQDLYALIQDTYGEVQDRDRYLAGRSAMMAVLGLASEYEEIAESLRNSDILDPDLRTYLKQADPGVIRSQTEDFLAAQREKGLWK
ncbi:MAG: hypothetical protein JXA95_17260 [Spirochaetales bacterium]|nr:hypothetical protein [Spirochaetales bacterium]